MSTEETRTYAEIVVEKVSVNMIFNEADVESVKGAEFADTAKGDITAESVAEKASVSTT